MAGMHGYVRVSRRDGRGGDKYISPGEQEGAVREAASRIGVELVDIVVEEDVSGSLPAEKRRLGEVLVACEEGRSSGVIVSNVDRLTRASKLDEAIIFERLSRAGARFVAANEGIDTDQPGADLTLDIMAALLQRPDRRAGGIRACASADVFDDLDQLVEAVAVVAGEVDELLAR